MDESERDQLIERIERLERSVKRGEDGLEVYASGFAKLRVELDAVRTLVVRRSRRPRNSRACTDTGSRCATRAAADAGRRSAAADTPRPAPISRRRPQTGRSASSHCGQLAGLGSRRRQGFAIAGGVSWRSASASSSSSPANRGGLEKACGLRSARPRPHSCSRPDWCCEHATAVLVGAAAVAAGIAGAYATLAAAVRFDLDDALALPLAG
jgi:hypothetical protein